MINSLPQAFAAQGGDLQRRHRHRHGQPARPRAPRTLVLIDGRRLMPGDPPHAGALAAPT
jgi:hypothetical protein